MLGDVSKYLSNDLATGKDRLGFQHYVEAIAEFLTDEDTTSPITLSIEGQWGCGKSSFMRQLKDEIEKGNICNISIREFLKYLLLNKKKAELPELKSLISKLKPLFFSINGYLIQNKGDKSSKQNQTFDIYSIKSKIKSILIYIS
ncbi:P-loop NTPase fold protein [Methanosarcina sp. T3]|uniref:P-loop NTPase fold protein n=1 Tax=Methanosarcina sp. T3 TaxID=3439062 RepID=UPI003F826036